MDAAGYGVTFISDNVAFVARFSNQLEQHRVETKKAFYSCETWKQHKISCLHLIATLRAVDKPKIAYELMGNCYKVAVYQASVGTLDVAEDHVLKLDLNILPAAYIRQAGRPKKFGSGHRVSLAGKQGSLTNVRGVVHRNTTRLNAAVIGVRLPRWIIVTQGYGLR